MADFFKVYGPILVLVLLGFLAAYQFVDPAPPHQLTIATGAEGGAYAAYGARYRDLLAREGIEVTLVASRGSVENLELLAGDRAESDGPSVDSPSCRAASARPASSRSWWRWPAFISNRFGCLVAGPKRPAA